VAVETQAFDLIRANLNRANLFAFGIGSSVNRFLIEGMARAGQGEPFIVTQPKEAEAEAKKFREYISSPVLTRIGVDFGGFQAYDVEPAAPADVLADRPLVLMGKWKGAADGRITVRGQSGEGVYEKAFPVAEAKAIESTKALAYLWARSRIAMLADYNQLRNDDERTREVVTLGLTYNLLTAYTSFVAVDNVVRNTGGNLAMVKQPLPLPQGVSNSAVGGSGASIQTTPEPETWMLMAVAVVFLGGEVLRRRNRRCA
jgi:Ca-activated chloride channel family protein